MRRFALPLGLLLVLLAAASPGQSTQPQALSSVADSPVNDDRLLALLSVLSQSAEESTNNNQATIGFQVTEIYDSNPLDVLRRPRGDEITSLNGSFGISKQWAHTTIAGNYNGGADFYYRLDRQDQMYHEASAAENFTFGRVTFLIGGDYEFLPSSSFGFDATHQITSGSLNLINPDLLPNQNIQTPPLSRVSYTGVGQMGLQLTPRSALNFSGSYAQLRYEKNGIPGTDQASGAAAYSYAFSSRDRIGAAYQYETFQTSGQVLQIVDQVATVSYAHRFAQNLTLKLGVGPDLRSYNNTRAKALQGVDPSIAVNAGLDYSRKSTHLTATLTRSTTSGQGILQGSESNQIEVAMSREIGRGWVVGGDAGYARSTSLARVVKNSRSQLVDQVFNSGYYSAAVTKRLGMFSLIFAYTLQTQDSTAPVCTASLCQSFPLHHAVTASVAFNPKPFKLQ